MQKHFPCAQKFILTLNKVFQMMKNDLQFDRDGGFATSQTYEYKVNRIKFKRMLNMYK